MAMYPKVITKVIKRTIRIGLPLIFVIPFQIEALSQFKINQQIAKGKYQVALELFSAEELQKESSKETVHFLAEEILRTGITSSDPQVLIASLYGYALSNSLPQQSCLKLVFHSENEAAQLLAVHLVSRGSGAEVEYLLKEALRSNFISVRFEALFQLAQKGSHQALPQLESLDAKLDEQGRAYLLPLFGLEGSQQGIEYIQRATHAGSVEMQAAAYLTLATCQHSLKLLPPTFLDPRIVEAFLYYASTSTDPHRFSIAERYREHHNPYIRLRAHALLASRDTSSHDYIEQMSRSGDIFALSLLSLIPKKESQLLTALLTSEDLDIQLNCALQLLQQRDPHTLLEDPNILLTLNILQKALTSPTVQLRPIYSPGRTIITWGIYPTINPEPLYEELSLQKKEEVMVLAASLPDQYFLPFAKEITEQVSALVPVTTSLLAARNATEVLEEIVQLSQNNSLSNHTLSISQLYALKALVVCTKKSELRHHLRNEVHKLASTSIFSPRPLLSWWITHDAKKSELQQQAIARFILEALNTLIEQQDPEATNLILSIMKNQTPTGMALLSGLLLLS